jgi:hypothetical protein
MGLFAIGSSAFGISLGVDVNVLKDAPGPHSIIAWNPGAGSTACGIVGDVECRVCPVVRESGCLGCEKKLLSQCQQCTNSGKALGSNPSVMQVQRLWHAEESPR